MRTLTAKEAVEWGRAHKIGFDRGGSLGDIQTGFHAARFEAPQRASKHVWFCRFLEKSLRPWSRCLFLITEWGIWESSENWHLYYRLRHSYGDERLLEEAPAHLFLDYEAADLISFMQVALFGGWGFCVFSQGDYSRIKVSHDGWVEWALRDRLALENMSRELTNSGLKRLTSAADRATPERGDAH
jgi:hypothetical protein